MPMLIYCQGFMLERQQVAIGMPEGMYAALCNGTTGRLVPFMPKAWRQ